MAGLGWNAACISGVHRRKIKGRRFWSKGDRGGGAKRERILYGFGSAKMREPRHRNV